MISANEDRRAKTRRIANAIKERHRYSEQELAAELDAFVDAVIREAVTIVNRDAVRAHQRHPTLIAEENPE